MIVTTINSQTAGPGYFTHCCNLYLKVSMGVALTVDGYIFPILTVVG